MGRCRKHPHHLVVGVCAYCLNDRLSALLDEEDNYEDLIQYTDISCSSQYISPIVLTSSNPSTSCGGTLPDTPLAAPHKVRMLCINPIDDITPRTSSQQFSLPISPLHRLDSNYYATSNPSPRSQAFFGNQDFVRGEIPRKKRSSIWSFLRRRKSGLYDSCGTAHWQHDYELEDGRNHHIHHDHDYGMHGHEVDIPTTTSWMRAQSEKSGLDRHGLSKMSSSSINEVQAGRFCKENVTPPLVGIMGNEETFSGGQHLSHAASNVIAAHCDHGTDGHDAHDNENRLGSTSSWISSFLPRNKSRKSKAISRFDMGSFGPAIQLTYRMAPPDVTSPRRARSVSFADEATSCSHKCMPAVKVPARRNVFKGVYHRSPIMYCRPINGYSKSHKSTSSFHGFLRKRGSEADDVHCASYENRVQSQEDYPEDYPRSDTCAHKVPQSAKPISSLFSKERSKSVSIDCGKDSRVSPIAMLEIREKDPSPQAHNTLLRSSHECISPLHGNRLCLRHHNCNMDGGLPRCRLIINKGFEEHSSTMPSDDEYPRSPRLTVLSAMKQHAKISPGLAPVNTMHSEAPEEQFGSHDLYSHSTKSWSKALSETLAPMLGIRRRKKQGVNRRGVIQGGRIHHVQHRMGEIPHDMHNGVFPPQSHHTRDQDVHQWRHLSDHHEYLSADQHDHHHPHPHQHGHGSNKAQELHVKESHVLPELDEKGPPQQYSFLSRDYSAFSFYFSPRQGFGNTNEAAYNSCKRVQAVGNSKPCTSNSYDIGG